MKKKNIFVTGGLGFIGSNLVELLLTKGYKVIVIDFKGIGSNKKNLKKHKNLILKTSDINRTTIIKNYIKSNVTKSKILLYDNKVDFIKKQYS